MSKFTPGPWLVDDECQISAGNKHIADAFPTYLGDNVWDWDVAFANASLIAAAPALLKALRDLEMGANTVDACYTRNPGNFAGALRDLREYAEKARAAIAKAEAA